jgi:hypothetical protein
MYASLNINFTATAISEFYPYLSDTVLHSINDFVPAVF